MALSSGSLANSSSLANSLQKRGFKEGRFHRGIRQAGPMLNEVDAQHGVQREPGAIVIDFVCV